MVLITGGAGYIGSHANKLFLKNGQETIVLDNLIYGHKECVTGGTFIEGDLSDTELLDSIFTNYKIDAVIHFAAFAYVGESVEKPAKYYRNNVANTINLLDAMVKHKVKFFIFSSTCATYGVPDKMPITEDIPQAPINPYGASKWMVERIVKDYSMAYGLSFCIFRYFNAAGCDPDIEIGEWHVPETHIIPLVLDAALGRRDHIEIFGTDYDTPDGTCIRDYIHVTDLANAHYLAYDYLKKGGESVFLNLGTKNGVSIREVIEKARTITGKEIKVVEGKRRAGDPPILIGSREKAEKVLGWVPKYSDLDTVISTAWMWHRKKFGNQIPDKHAIGEEEE